MAHSLSAKKRIKQNEKSRVRNKSKKSAMKSAMKKVMMACKENDVESARSFLPKAMSLIDKAAKDNAIHFNTAGRRKARLQRLIARTAQQATPSEN